MNESQKEQLLNNIHAAMYDVPERIQMRQLAHFYNADPAYGKGVADKLGIDIKRVEIFAMMNLKELFAATSEEEYSREAEPVV